jgi:hypothetical protein
MTFLQNSTIDTIMDTIVTIFKIILRRLRLNLRMSYDDGYVTQSIQLAYSTGPGRKLVLCVQLPSCVYMSSVPVQQCVHLLSTASQQLCVHYLPNIVALKDSASWKKVVASRPLLKSFKMIYRTRFILIF